MKKRIIFLLLSFFIPFFILFFIFYLKGYFFDNTIITGDSYAQYYPLFNYLKDIFNGSCSLFYSFNKNLGGTMFGTFFYYLSSPLNVFLLIFEKSNIPMFMTIMTIVKISLCGLTMYFYMSYKYKSDSLLIIALSVCYALMGYNLNFYINIMWLDVVLLTPIVILGLDKLINKESPLMYMIFLFVSIFSNYYISYMLCIFCVLYFVYEVLLKYNFKVDRKEILFLTKRFLICSFLVGMMCSFFLIPCFFESKSYFRSLDFSGIFKFDYNFFDLFSKSYIGSISSADVLNYSSMNIYCSIITIPFVYFYIVNKNVCKKERILTLLFIVFMIIPCFVFPLNYVWHLFSSPSFYSYRYSFLLCFFLITITYKSYMNLILDKVYFLLYLVFFSIISLYFVLITCFGNYYDFLNYRLIWLSLFILFFYFFVLFIKNDKIRNFLFVFLLFFENVLNVGIVFYNDEFFSSASLSHDLYNDIVDEYNTGRMEFTDLKFLNGSLLMKYYGINIFLSTNNNRVMRFLTQSGSKELFISQNMYSYVDGEYILDSIIGLKYIVSSYKIDNYKLVETIKNENFNESGVLYIYENPNYAGISYMIKNECNGIDFSFNYDEKVFNCIMGIDKKYYKENKVVQYDDKYKAVIGNYSNFYLYYPDIINKPIKVDFSSIVHYGDDYIYFKNDKKDFDFEFFHDINSDDLKIFSFDYKSFSSEFNIRERLDYRIQGNKLVGTVDTNGGILMITIPYEKGYIIKVDGERVNYKEVIDTFIGIDLDEGFHSVEVSYEQPYLKFGIIVSITSFLISFFYYVKTIYKKKFK